MDNPFQIWQPSPSPTSLPPPSSNSVPPAAFPLQIRRQPPHQRHLAASQWLRRHPATGSANRAPPLVVPASSLLSPDAGPSSPREARQRPSGPGSLRRCSYIATALVPERLLRRLATTASPCLIGDPISVLPNSGDQEPPPVTPGRLPCSPLSSLLPLRLSALSWSLSLCPSQVDAAGHLRPDPEPPSPELPVPHLPCSAPPPSAPDLAPLRAPRPWPHPWFVSLRVHARVDLGCSSMGQPLAKAQLLLCCTAPRPISLGPW